MLEPLTKKKDTFMRDAITPHERLSATLRFLSSGESFEDFKFLTAISPHSLSRILPKTENDWKCIANDFNTLWNFPNCIGAIDGKHVEIMKPPGTGSYYYNYKKSYSIFMMAIVNAKYEFIAVEVGANGRASDAGIFGQNRFKEEILQTQRNPFAINTKSISTQLDQFRGKMTLYKN
ncbi:uncharacterized protein LOC129250235 [Anastrepha obliqua]|uniref:uncharacterized protein LOC129250235 n=1 Tax=Anastrepha obliqua TaxID=95512 RepID=UPI00240A8512|nr:uncharacterized protein LOC129250235 [Anastrepha obliqua]